ncbi:MAG: hypothetical protein M3R31_13795 [Pseudomonadota bacterium]|nr:hypothetical protein [Pseudomonadota bacterium]
MPTESSPKPQQNIPKWLGPVIVAGAVLIALHGRPSPGVPQWVASAACAAFLAVGVVLTAQAFGFPGVAKWVAPLIVFALAGIMTWIGFAPGERECASSFSFFGLGSGGVFSCKPVFALAAILIWLFFAAVLWINYLRKPPKD